MIAALALLATAVLFGGMVLYSFGFAAFLFNALPADEAGVLLRRAFPHFYLFVIGAALVAAGLVYWSDPAAAILLALIALTTWPTRSQLMPAINRATDAGDTKRFHRLHGLSVVITLIHIAVAGWVLIRFL